MPRSVRLQLSDVRRHFLDEVDSTDEDVLGILVVRLRCLWVDGFGIGMEREERGKNEAGSGKTQRGYIPNSHKLFFSQNRVGTDSSTRPPETSLS